MKCYETCFVNSLATFEHNAIQFYQRIYVGPRRRLQDLTSQQVGVGTSRWHHHLYFPFMHSLAHQASSHC